MIDVAGFVNQPLPIWFKRFEVVQLLNLSVKKEVLK